MIKPIEFDRSYWRTDDPQWLAERERKWSLYLAYMASRNGWSKEWDEQPQKDAWKDYYLNGNVHKDHNAWQDLCILHPDPTAESLCPLMQQLQKDYPGYFNFLGTVYSRYPLVDVGFVSADHLRQLYLILQGKNYRESANILGFDPENNVEKAASDIATSIFDWRREPGSECWPIELIVNHFKSIFVEIRARHMKKLENDFSMFCDILSFYKEDHPHAPEEKLDLVREVIAFLFSSDVDPCVTDIASRYMHPNGERKV
ncbi:hypothetical protein EZV61_01955 [Corallincola luteus]|uniref:Uncharacterized protein n=1 Tax=Corallincola luteus TaxID=1775177 RepID=A0ABY2ANI1_9GAMM|nr:hypothetical protein [Corallincola luteus]TCI04759.1 hypothetical protein EZV61_01955 [Corallincola luteus]